MDKITSFLRDGDLRSKIMLCAAIVLGIMILFPPKFIEHKNPLLGITDTQSAGYTFILSDPAGQEKAEVQQVAGDQANQLVASGVQWGRLLLQIIVVGVAAGAATFYLDKRDLGGSGNQPI
jgi:hypothetical protein